MLNLFSVHTLDIRIPGIVDTEVIPKDQAVLPFHTQHLACDSCLKIALKNRSEDSKLADKIELFIGELEFGCISAMKLHGSR